MHNYPVYHNSEPYVRNHHGSDEGLSQASESDDVYDCLEGKQFV